MKVHGCGFERQNGAALIVGLVLMLVLTVLGVSGMTTSVFGLNMATNSQQQLTSFQAAETGVDVILGQRNFTTAGGTTHNDSFGAYSVSAQAAMQGSSGIPGEAYSLGVGSGSFQAFHFEIQSTGSGPDGSRSQLTQGFYVVAGVAGGEF